MAIQIGKYKRPGIFLEEYDNSVIATPIVEGITNLVIGVSKKGPINTPVRLTTVSDLESIFGQLDRGLERKGSYFHRTVSKMLESSPVFAMNLLLTDDTLDTIEYKSVSTSSGKANDMERLGAYRRFHDTTGFWKRDTESFLNLTKTNTGYSDRVLNFTNLSDRYATVFVFNSKVSGFDRTLIEWYGSIEKVPTYVNSSDWASDYMVDVVIIAGDWSDYRTLSVDPRWSAYFNANGLRKEQIRNFANDRNVSALAYYEGLSLIPYFRDANGRNIFIETTINRDTDKTGIFCAYNNDLVEADFYNGKIDIIGQTIVGNNKESIEFLSYQDTITEQVDFTTTPLDLPGNVTALIGSYYQAVGDAFGNHAFEKNNNPRTSGVLQSYDRTTYYAEDFVRNVSLSASASRVDLNTVSVTYKVHTDGGYAVIGDNLVELAGPMAHTLSISSFNFATSSTALVYKSAFVLDSTGNFKVVTGDVPNTTPSVESSDIVLGHTSYTVQSQQFQPTVTQTNVYIDPENTGITAYRHLLEGTDYTITLLPSQIPGSSQTRTGAIEITFLGTNKTPDLSDYQNYRRFKAFNRLVDLLDSPNREKMTMLINGSTMKKASMANMEITNIETSTTQNKSFILVTGLDPSEITDVTDNGLLVFYTKDNELILGEESIVSKDQTVDSNWREGVVGKYSNLYSKFYDGQISTGDVVYNNRIKYNGLETSVATYSVHFVPGETLSAVSGFLTGPTTSYAGNDYIVLMGGATDPQFQLNDIIKVKGAVKNTGNFTIVSGKLNSTTFGAGSGFVYQVNENTTYEYLSVTDQISDMNPGSEHYLKMYLDGEKITINFVDAAGATSSLLNWDGSTSTEGVQASTNFTINSMDTNFKQSIEIEVPSGYTEVDNKILVNAQRYPEVMKGDFLEAEYDESTLEIGQVARKMTRILDKKQYSKDVSLMEITCDSKIKKVYSGSAYQTTRYKKVENYIETYKAISLKGFRVRQASLPDGTETKQNQILNLVAKGTPLFKALTNKEAIDFRYLIDSFGNGLTENSKQQLADICGDRLDAFGFLNMPSMRAFKNSSSPSFVNSEGVLQAEYIAKGADPESGPAFYYTFAQGEGTTCIGYFLPYVSVNDNGRPMDFPPASFVAATYMRKHISNLGGLTPWTIAAGVINGRITGINGIEIDFTPSDIEFLNQAQMNPIVFKRNRGNVIETENTAQTLYKSALSYIHVREVLIELERELSRMLLDFQWQFNTSEIRSEIKMRADMICETFVSRNGLYNYFNKMDEENNTAEIIDNQIGVLDTYVEPIKGMGIIVNNVTILRTGAIDSGGFI